MHGLIFETSVWLLAGSTRLISYWFPLSFSGVPLVRRIITESRTAHTNVQSDCIPIPLAVLGILRSPQFHPTPVWTNPSHVLGTYDRNTSLVQARPAETAKYSKRKQSHIRHERSRHFSFSSKEFNSIDWMQIPHTNVSISNQLFTSLTNFLHRNCYPRIYNAQLRPDKSDSVHNDILWCIGSTYSQHNPERSAQIHSHNTIESKNYTIMQSITVQYQ
jgi:hypothetical protein